MTIMQDGWEKAGYVVVDGRNGDALSSVMDKWFVPSREDNVWGPHARNGLLSRRGDEYRLMWHYNGRTKMRYDWPTSTKQPAPVVTRESENAPEGMLYSVDDVPTITLPPATTLPQTSVERKDVPLYAGVLRYFPAALALVARISKFGNDKHNGPGAPLQHARGKSGDHADCILRHLVDLEGGAKFDPESGLSQVGYIAWRALALAQEWLEQNEGAPPAPAAKFDDEEGSDGAA